MQVQSARLLLDAGADPSMQDTAGQRAGISLGVGTQTQGFVSERGWVRVCTCLENSDIKPALI